MHLGVSFWKIERLWNTKVELNVDRVAENNDETLRDVESDQETEVISLFYSGNGMSTGVKNVLLF